MGGGRDSIHFISSALQSFWVIMRTEIIDNKHWHHDYRGADKPLEKLKFVLNFFCCNCDHYDTEFYLYDNNDDEDERMKGKKIMISLCALLIVYTVVQTPLPSPYSPNYK